MNSISVFWADMAEVSEFGHMAFVLVVLAAVTAIVWFVHAWQERDAHNTSDRFVDSLMRLSLYPLIIIMLLLVAGVVRFFF